MPLEAFPASYTTFEKIDISQLKPCFFPRFSPFQQKNLVKHVNNVFQEEKLFFLQNLLNIMENVAFYI